MEISNKTLEKIYKLDIDTPGIKFFLDQLIRFNETLVGWRESCGKTDSTMKVKRNWTKVLKLLSKENIILKEERIKIDNSYATNKGGFWNEIRYTYTSEK